MVVAAGAGEDESFDAKVFVPGCEFADATADEGVGTDTAGYGDARVDVGTYEFHRGGVLRRGKDRVRWLRRWITLKNIKRYLDRYKDPKKKDSRRNLGVTSTS